MFNWIKKKFGYHVCEEFTQWTDRSVTYCTTHTRIGGVLVALADPNRWSERFQERRCTTCGKVEQRKLEFQ